MHESDGSLTFFTKALADVVQSRGCTAKAADTHVRLALSSGTKGDTGKNENKVSESDKR